MKNRDIPIPKPSPKTMKAAHRLMRESDDPEFRALAMAVFRWEERAENVKVLGDRTVAEYERLIAGIQQLIAELRQPPRDESGSQ